ncbi:TonB-dependent receptor [Sphingobium sp.]|uniref:TonB-dependent receptor n=1 Tax=Sphingobium sp. TaxID=1912891 RepID=UPI0028BDD832|nr:TonB-dependent receptor [Sphingobium sp.]
MLGSPAYAQATGEAEPPQGSAESQSGQIADIVVTAQRRTESAQSVPISLQSFSSDTLQNAKINGTDDLSSVVGGVFVLPTSSRPSLYIRGVGTNSTNTTPAVLTFVDGVYMPMGNRMDFANISSIEVLKGPQGTLFGRNATGGVVQITTAPPSETASGRAEFGYGNYETVDANAYVTGPLAQGVAYDVAAAYSNQNEGFGRNLATGHDVFKTRTASARARLRAELGEDSSLMLTGFYSQGRGNAGTTVAPAFGYGFINVQGVVRTRGSAFFPGDYDVNLGPRDPYYKVRSGGGSATFETKFSDVTFRSITAYQTGRELGIIDFDGGPNNITNLTIDRNRRKSFTQELQLLSGTGGRFDWVAGAFYYYGLNGLLPFTFGTPPNGTTRQSFATDVDKSIAPYAQLSYEILPNTKLTLGGRYTFEKRSIEGRVEVNGVLNPASIGKLSQTFKEPTWRVALDHKFGPTAMVYASVSRGFNSGFYNQQGLGGFATETQNPRVLPEFLTAWEAGTKLDLLDRHLRVNLSAFYYEYSGLQQQIYTASGATITINAAEARIKGLDFEVVARPFRSLTLSLSGTYLDAYYRSYPLAPKYVLCDLSAPGVPTQCTSNGTVVAAGSEDAKGHSITNTPEWSYTFAATHELPTAIGTFTTSLNLNYRGKAYIDPGNRFELPTRYVANLTERWTSKDDSLFATVWVKNLFDKQYDFGVNILAPVGLAGNPAPPRTYGASVGFKF